MVPKLYAYFNNTEGFSVLVMELLGINLKKYLVGIADDIDPRIITNIQVRMVSFESNIWNLLGFFDKIDFRLT